jgi:hypothetical protein
MKPEPLKPYQLALAMHAAQADASGLPNFAAELRAELRADLARESGAVQ